MAVTDVTTWKLLNRWPEIMEANSYLFNQITGQGVPMPQDCGQRSLYIQRDRDMIADALHDAVTNAAASLNFYPRPTYCSERITLGKGVPLERQTLMTRWKHLAAFGRRATSLIEAGAAVTYSDANGDGVLDTATITLVLATDVSADEIQVFFRTADGAPNAADDLWQIEPLRVVKSGLNVTITGSRALFADPGVWAIEYDPPSFVEKYHGDVGNAAYFVTAVDVYRVYTDSTNALVFNADPLLDCSVTGLDSNVTFTAVGRIVDAEIGSFMARRSDGCPPYLPVETIDVQYLAGLPLVNGLMDRRLEKALIRYSNTLMGQQPESFCQRQLNMWQWDTKVLDPNALPAYLASNPLGLAQGAVETWRVVSKMALPGGGKL